MHRFISFSYQILCSKSSDIPLNSGYMTVEWNQVTKLIKLLVYFIDRLILTYFIKVYYIFKCLFIHQSQMNRQTDKHTNIRTKLTKDSKQAIRVSVTQ